MVTFKEDRYIIEVEASSPEYDWLILHSGLCHLLRNVNSDNIINETLFAVVDFLDNIMPDYRSQKCKIEVGEYAPM